MKVYIVEGGDNRHGNALERVCASKRGADKESSNLLKRLLRIYGDNGAPMKVYRKRTSLTVYKGGVSVSVQEMELRP